MTLFPIAVNAFSPRPVVLKENNAISKLELNQQYLVKLYSDFHSVKSIFMVRFQRIQYIHYINYIPNSEYCNCCWIQVGGPSPFQIAEFTWISNLCSDSRVLSRHINCLCLFLVENMYNLKVGVPNLYRIYFLRWKHLKFKNHKISRNSLIS